MVTISDLSTTGQKGQPIYGTAAILRRIFSSEEISAFESYTKEYKKLIQDLGYDRTND